MKKTILVAAIGAMALNATAGDWGKAPVYDKAPKAPIEECIDLGGEISAGYMTDYVFYGVRFARDSVFTDVNYTFDSIVPITVGAWYLNGTNDPDSALYDELDLYLSADLGNIAGFDTSLSYTHYFFPELGSGDSYGEIGLDARYGLGFVDFVAETNAAFFGDRTRWYHQVGLEKSIPVTDAVSLVLGGGVGYSDNYFAGLVAIPGNGDSGFNHYYLNASLPIQLNCRTTLTPYIGYVGAPDGWVADGINGISIADGLQSDILHGGVSLSVSF